MQLTKLATLHCTGQLWEDIWIVLKDFWLLDQVTITATLNPLCTRGEHSWSTNKLTCHPSIW
jgi:hypothetical protein